MTPEELQEYNRRLKKHGPNRQDKSKAGGFLLAIVIFALAFGGYRGYQYFRQKEARERAEKEFAEQQERYRQQNKPIVIKGFFIGMTAEQMRQAVQTKLGAPWRVYDGTDPKHVEIVTDALIVKGDSPIYVSFDAEGKANSFHFSPNCSQIAFNAGDLNDEEFVNSLLKAYDIPEMKWTHAASGVGCWQYVTPNNVRIRVSKEKEIVVERLADQPQGRFN